MTLRYKRFGAWFMATLMLAPTTGFAGDAWGEGFDIRDELAPADTVRGGLGQLPPWQRTLSGEDSIRVAELEAQIAELREQADYAEAIPLAEEALEIRRRVQGDAHWQTADAVRLAETLAHVASLPAEAQAELAEADRAEAEGLHLYQTGDFDQALGLAQRQLEIRRRLLGEAHPEVAEALNNVAGMLREKGDYAGAESLYRDVLAMSRELFGDEHPRVAQALNGLGVLLWETGDYDDAEQAFRQGLELARVLLGIEHPQVGACLNNLASLLVVKGDYPKAEALCREALAVWRAAYGEEHSHVATSLDLLASTLLAQGNAAAAEPLYRGALGIWRSVCGAEHPRVATGLSNLARTLRAKGDRSGAESLYRDALAMSRKLLGDEHPQVALTLNNLATLLAEGGDHQEADLLYQEALAAWRASYGDEHPRVAMGLSNLATTRRAMGDYAGAKLLHQDALSMRRRTLGDEHPSVARSLENLAATLRAVGDCASAESLYHEALALRRRVLDEGHPSIALTCHRLAGLLYHGGEYAAAETVWVSASRCFETARLRTGLAGLERVGFATERSPLGPLAACQARNGRPGAAWTSLEANLARGLLDEVSARFARPLDLQERNREQSMLGQLAQIDERIGALASAGDSTSESRAGAISLRLQRDHVLAELTQFQADVAARYGVTAGESYELPHVQEHLPAEAALLAWVDMKGDSSAANPDGEHWACAVRHRGEPVWIELPGSGPEGEWTSEDDRLPRRTREALSRGGLERTEDQPWQVLVGALYTQRVAPVQPHLSGVRQLIVLPAGWMAGVPVEALTDDYTISYDPSATMYAWLKEGRRSQVEGHRSKDETQTPPSPGEAGWRPLLALGDPVFGAPVEPDTVLPEPPDQGVMLATVMDGSNAARGGLRSGDVLLSYGEEQLSSADDLGPAIEQIAEVAEDTSRSVPVRVWRQGKTLDVAVAPGELGVSPSPQPAPEAVRAKRRLDSLLEQTRGTTFEPLPGTRLEVEAIARLFAEDPRETRPTILLGREASERRLDDLATSGELGRFRFIHLATHGVMDDDVAMQSALILSREPLDDSFDRAVMGSEVYDGRLTAEQVVRTWRLDADLVTLSACESALGKESGGEGYLGFSQALFVSGARSLVLSLWNAQDTPTLLLMRRFYENLLGRFDEPRVVGGQRHSPGTPFPKAEALREAKEWLRSITWEQLPELEMELWSGDARGQGETPAPAAGTARPYEDPHYWAAFILMGNPD